MNALPFAVGPSGLGAGSGGVVAFWRPGSGRLIDGAIRRDTTGLATTALRLGGV
jgi:hypothetical protein